VNTWHGAAPPGFVRRWVVQARTAGSWPSTTLFDLAEDRRHVMVRPAAVDTFSILIDAAGVRVLLETIDSQAACAVPGRHARHGTWLLGLRPSEPSWTDRPAGAPPSPGPLELYVLLPGDEIHIRYRREHIAALRYTLAEILQSMMT
jgi:hypothetical protein